MAALTKAVYDSALTEDDEPAEPSVARFLPGGTTVAALIIVVILIAAAGVWRHAAAREHAQALATRIISYRATHPRLSTVEELDDVPGIGPSLIEKIRPGVC